jgi:hypothetical protein
LKSCSLLRALMADQSDTYGRERRTVAALISPVAVCPAQKTSPGTLTAGPGAWIVSFVLLASVRPGTYSCAAWLGTSHLKLVGATYSCLV